ncbi:hypothetical protein SprV_0301244300 [Sparganum proliferum]
MSLDPFEERLHTASFVSHRIVAVKTEKLCGVRCLPINCRFKFTVEVSSDEHIQEGQLLFLFFSSREFYIREDCVEQAVEMLQHVLPYDDERVVNVTAPKHRFVLEEDNLFSAQAHNRQAKKREILEPKLTKLKPPGAESSNLVHNLSSKQLTEQQLRVLQHETCFTTADADPVDFIAALEAMLVRSGTSDDMKHSVRQRVTSLLMTHRPTRCISQSESKVMNELRRDDSIIILPADKGRSTVVMNREDYNEKAKALLDDREFYRPAQKSQAKAVADRLSKLLREYRHKNVITENEWHQMRATDTALARFYGLPKIHKANVSLRPIVALKGSPTYNLAKWMYSKLKFLQGNSTTSVRSASQFLIDLRGRRIQSDEIMVSFDVTSLFTSIPPKVAREVLRKRLEEAYDETQNALKIEHLMKLFEFCQQTFFTFAGETYEQIKGTPMGSPVSGLVAELVLRS